MRLFSIADLHLSLATASKSMDKFGEAWKNHVTKVAEYWDTTVTSEDLVLIPGDISWAMTLQQALPDLEWIAKRPGIKVMIRGNHDYWWSSISKVRSALPQTLYALQNDSLVFGEYAIAGTRLWDSSEYTFNSIIDFRPIEGQETISSKPESNVESEQLFERELGRLELSLKSLPSSPFKRIVMTHYPPIGLDLAPSRVSALLEKYAISLCLFGHLHSIKPDIKQLFGTARGVRYELVSCDWLACHPLELSF